MSDAQRPPGRPERDRRPGDQWSVLRHRDQLHAVLRRHLQPAVLRGGDLERIDASRPGPRRARVRPAVPSSRSTPSSDQVVLMKVGISFVSVANAADNLRAEDPGWSLGQVESAATQPVEQPARSHPDRWRLPAQHAHLLHRALPLAALPQRGQRRQRPVHRRRRAWSTSRPTRAQYANFSEWDIYRSRDRAGVAARPPPGRRHGPVTGQRRRAGGMAAQVGHRRRRCLADERRLRRSDHRRRLRLRGPRTSTSAPRWPPWSREPPRPRPGTGWRSSGSTSTSTWPSTTSMPARSISPPSTTRSGDR